MRFTKMEGLGNDYIYINAFEEKITPDDAPALARAMSDRHFGVGSDGLVLIAPSGAADFRMYMYNADGSRGPMCGNASRCIGKYVWDHGMTKKTDLLLETDSGIRRLWLTTEGGLVSRVRVDMGRPGIGSPLSLRSADRVFDVLPVNTGSNHAVIFLDEPVEAFDLERYGAPLEYHEAFPMGVNVEFVNVLSPERLRMRVWERGSGETMACGTGSCAVLAAACAKGYSGRKASVELRGGTLEDEWDAAADTIFMTGPAREVFSGEWPDPAPARP